MLENTVAMRKAVEASLRSGTLFNTKITVNFQADVSKYLRTIGSATVTIFQRMYSHPIGIRYISKLEMDVASSILSFYNPQFSGLNEPTSKG